MTAPAQMLAPANALLPGFNGGLWRRPPLAGTGRMALLLMLALIGPLIPAASAQPAEEERSYSLPALPLNVALARFSEISGVDVLLRAPGGNARPSPPLKGRYRPAEALTKLLRGSGLSARFTSPRSAVILPSAEAHAPAAEESASTPGGLVISLDMMRVTAPRMIGAPPPRNADEAFTRRLASTIRRIAIEKAVFAGGKKADLRIATRISPEGALYEVAVVEGSADAELNARASTLLEGAPLGFAPPEGLRQPLVFELSGR